MNDEKLTFDFTTTNLFIIVLMLTWFQILRFEFNNFTSKPALEATV